MIIWSHSFNLKYIYFSLSYFDHWVFAGATELPNLNLMAAISRILSPLLLQFSTHPFLLQTSFLIYSASSNLPTIDFFGIEWKREYDQNFVVYYSPNRDDEDAKETETVLIAPSTGFGPVVEFSRNIGIPRRPIISGVGQETRIKAIFDLKGRRQLALD